MVFSPTDAYFKSNKKRQYVRSDLIVKAFYAARAKFIDPNMWELALQWRLYLPAFIDVHLKNSAGEKRAAHSSAKWGMTQRRIVSGWELLKLLSLVAQTKRNYIVRVLPTVLASTTATANTQTKPTVAGDVFAKHGRIVGGKLVGALCSAASISAASVECESAHVSVIPQWSNATCTSE